MTRSPYTNEEVVEAVARHGSIKEAAAALGMKYDAVQKRLKRSGADIFPSHPGKSILYDGETGEPKLVWSKAPNKAPTEAEVAEAVSEALKGFRPPAALKTALRGDKDLLGIWPLADLHMGLRAWGKETGGPDWDTGIAKKRYQEGLAEVTQATPKVKQAVVLCVGDLSHADNYQQTTTNPNTNHLCDVDGRYPHMLEASIDTVLHTVSLALQRAESVSVVILPGNHDGATSVAVRLAVAAYYRNQKNVKVEKSPSRYWWYTWGLCMFGATHGDKAKVRQLPLLMAASQPEMWGKTRFRHIFTGHFHSKVVEEHPGVMAEILPSPAPADSWTAEMGFLSQQAFETKVYHKERGLRCTPNVIL